MAGLVSAGCFFLADDERTREADVEDLREGLNDAADGLEDAAVAMKDAVEGLFEGGNVDQPLHYSELYEFLDEEIEGFTRTSRKGSTQGLMGMDVTTVEARYEREDGARIDVVLVDLGALPVAAVSNFAEFADFNVDEESDRGWKRSTKFDGHPAMEEFIRSGDSDLGRANFSSLIAERFVLTLEGRRIEWEDLTDFLDEIDTDEIEDRKDDEG